MSVTVVVIDFTYVDLAALSWVLFVLFFLSWNFVILSWNVLEVFPKYVWTSRTF